MTVVLDNQKMDYAEIPAPYDTSERACAAICVLHGDYNDPITFYCTLAEGHAEPHTTTEIENGFDYKMTWRDVA